MIFTWNKDKNVMICVGYKWTKTVLNHLLAYSVCVDMF